MTVLPFNIIYLHFITNLQHNTIHIHTAPKAACESEVQLGGELGYVL